MNNRDHKIKNIARAIFVFTGTLFFFWLFLQNAVWSGTFTAEQNFHDSSVLISPFSPEATRVHTRDRAQLIVGEPVYLDLRVPRSFATVKLSLTYRTDYGGIVRIGPVLDEHAWQFVLRPLETTVLQDGWMRGTAELDLTGVSAKADRRVRVLLSAPGISEELPIELQNIRAEFQGKPMTLQKLFSHIWLEKL
ncbi:MAG: hypothetical protein COT39_02390 [Parcubacteria group bacterium CG08_land_8_20_14_0_20_48_21]|nr:MAG: hypothetical protein AUK21_03285 [Parcubacteria group bacterium CG2_30_48_51]PIS32842.1 MAG: hypothetical protein COT39_02390 [Parcubacteria group bacterium CG08_land_8_20_14_0_20_48_21]PIW78940.1 MAG: hypothetical protein COZ99_03765 [Parcubacteria group bacterium CG_4_8_14_3_um_filter_48_16]PIY78169.1 MAG: hypothetical protein COY83_01265 [Parcubacteria group bacterium CG_4_10_14_0_8_um_filter_48_154]PIZ77876.1 MAG: hypothetical protein COY03_01295 [bacterium CG_4_10_14_0_2_um_filter_